MFSLTVKITSVDLKYLKRDVGAVLPGVKSSHRCEAIARGFGFGTYASLLAALKSGSTVSVPVSGARFCAYLDAHGFKAHPPQFYRPSARVALRKLMHDEPRLTLWGIGIGQPQRGRGDRRETLKEFNARFVAERAALDTDEAAEQFLASLTLLAEVPRTKTVRPKTGSYWLKHVAENLRCTYPEGDELGPRYVANGALVAAALHLGFKAGTSLDDLGYVYVHVRFNMSPKALIDLDCSIRPDGPQAQERRRREERLAKPWATMSW